MNKKVEKVLQKAIEDTKGKKADEIILYCDNKIKRARSTETIKTWEIVKNKLLEINENIKFKIGEKVHWLKGNKEVDYSRTDTIENIIIDIWGSIRYETKEIVNEGARARRGIAYTSYLVTAN